MRNRVPEYQASNRGYLTVAVGCTGGQHRSVYIVDRLAEAFAAQFDGVTARHSGLPGAKLFQPPPRQGPQPVASPKLCPRVQVACATPGEVITWGSFSPLMKAMRAVRACHGVAIAQLDQRARVAGLEHEVACQLEARLVAPADDAQQRPQARRASHAMCWAAISRGSTLGAIISVSMARSPWRDLRRAAHQLVHALQLLEVAVDLVREQRVEHVAEDLPGTRQHRGAR